MGAVIQTEAERPLDGSDLTDSLSEVKKLRAMCANYVTSDKQRAEDQAELERRRPSGKVQIIYENYTDCFNLKDGSISVKTVDEEYCLTDIMPGCTLELIEMTPQDRIAQEVLGIPTPFIEKSPQKDSCWEHLYTYEDGISPKSYWLLAFQDAATLEADLLATKKRMEAMGGGDDVSTVCTCTNGQACSAANKDNCKDWNNRFQVAMKYKAWLSSSIAPSNNHDRYGGVVAE